MDAVVSVPGYWSDAQRQSMIHACNIAGLNCLRLMHEVSLLQVTTTPHAEHLTPARVPGNRLQGTHTHAHTLITPTHHPLLPQNTATALAFGIFKSAKGLFDAEKESNVMFLDLGQLVGLNSEEHSPSHPTPAHAGPRRPTSSHATSTQPRPTLPHFRQRALHCFGGRVPDR